MLKTLQSPAAWDATAMQYSQVAKGFTHGFAKDAWESIVTNKDNVRVLDVACGTGAVSVPAAEELQSTGGYVLATDFSPKMVDIVQQAIAEKSLTNIEARVEDGQDLHIPDNSFDYGFSVFGLIFFPNVMKGFSEFFRVLKSGGKVAVVTWTPQNIMLQVSLEMMRRKNKVADFPFLYLKDEETLTKELSKAGFKDIKVIPVTKDMPIPDHEIFVTRMNSNPAFSFLSEVLGMDSDRKKFEEEYLAIMKELVPAVPAAFPSTALIGIGTKP